MSTFGFHMNAPVPHRRSWWQFAVALLLVIAVIVVGLQRMLGGPADYTDGSQGPLTLVTVNKGDTLSMIGKELTDAGIVASVDAVVQAGAANARSGYITPGDYKLPSHIPASTAISLLLNPQSRDSLKLVVPEGMRATSIYSLVARTLKTDVNKVRAAFHALPLPASSGGEPEGYLFPATYEVGRRATPADVANMMLARFQQAAVQLELERRARAEQLSTHDVLVIASILEQEGAPEDFSKIARVILNRLARNMPLQLDSTVNYGLSTTHLNLSQSQLDKDTPYNTYLHEGLPPTPIDNPGQAAIEAALSPATGDWLYFVTTDPTRKITEFANTYQQFLVLKAKYQRNN